MQTKRADDELEFSRVPYSDPKQSGRLLVTVIEAEGGRGGGWGGGGGGGALASIIDKKMIIKK